MPQPLALPRPQPGDYNPAAAGYLQLAPVINDACGQLASQHDRLVERFAAVSDDKATFRYAPDKWTVREVIGHLSDAERIFGYRMLRIGRGDQTPLPGFEENDYVPAGEFERRSLKDIVSEWTACATPRLRWSAECRRLRGCEAARRTGRA
jgi:hypothetical protein